MRAAWRKVARRSSRPGRLDGAWRRVIVEKPFGHDLASARALNRELSQTLRGSHPILFEHLAHGSVQVVGAVYDLHTGMIEWR